MIFLFLIILGVISVRCFGYYLACKAFVRWIQINGTPYPSDKEIKELSALVVDDLVKGLTKSKSGGN